MPLEIMVDRGFLTLTFGPLKPVGLMDPKTGQQPFAAVQLRAENREGTLYNLVGFQTKLTYPEQKRVFRMIPGLENAEFARLGSIHRNTFIRSPGLLSPHLNFFKHPNIFLAGQISGVEGYVESAAMGLLAGNNAARLARNQPLVTPPRSTALGALIHHLTKTDTKDFQPMNVNFGLFPPLEGRTPKKLRGATYAERALAELGQWTKELGEEGQGPAGPCPLPPRVRARVGFRMKRVSYFMGRRIRYSRWQNDFVYRFFRKGKGGPREREIHPGIVIDGEIEALDGLLLHFPYPSLEDYLGKFNRYTSAAARDRLKAGKRLRWVDAPDLAHNWECGYLYETTTKTLLCGDLLPLGCPSMRRHPAVKGDA